MPSPDYRPIFGVCVAGALLLTACDGGNDTPEDDAANAEAPAYVTQPEDEAASAEAAEGSDDLELDGELPPVDPLALEPLYGEALAELGVELTERGGLIDRSDGYQVSEDGTHLALYVAPTGERTDDEYVDGIVELAQLFLPDVFDRWPGLETFDVCQELPEDEETGYILPVTQIDIGRTAAADVDWEAVELVDLLRAAEDDDTFTLQVRGDLRLHPRVREARREARDDEGSGWSS